MARLMSNLSIITALILVAICFAVLHDEMRSTYEEPGWYIFPLPFLVFYGVVIWGAIATIPPGQEKDDFLRELPAETSYFSRGS